MTHRWKFFRAGGVDQVALLEGADLAELGELDQRLWVALSMPTTGVDVDARTLKHLDADGDGRVRPPELLEAVRWATQALTGASLLLAPQDRLALAEIRDPAVLASARRILADLGRKDAEVVTLADVEESARIFTVARFNGDGVVAPATADDEGTRKALEDILASVGGVPDRSGQTGVDQALADRFFADAQAVSDWYARGEAGGVFPLGSGSEAAAAALGAVRAKIDDHFVRCRLAAIDPRAAAGLGGTDAGYAALAFETLGPSSPAVAALPLSPVAAEAPVRLDGGVNPAWAAAIATFAAAVVEPILGPRPALSEAEWKAILERFAAHDAWMAERPVTRVADLGVPRLRELLGPPRAAVDALLAADRALEAEFKGMTDVERLVLYRRDLLKVLNNYVAFADFYGRKGATFLAGRLLLDARACDLCLEVPDASKHALLAASSGVYLAYCDITRGGAKKTIVAAFTSGDSYNLVVGRNGVFYDRQGKDWDATITKILANAISVREAFWSPYRKLVRMVEEQIAKRAAAADADAQAQLTLAATQVAHADKRPDPKAAPAKKIDIGTVAALGVALGSIGTFLGLLLGKFVDLGIWMPVGLIALVLLVSGPSVLLACLKLRQRNLGPILDASGWAINTKAMLNVPFGTSLTGLPRLPAGATRNLDDPFAQKRPPWKLYAVLALLALGAYLWSIGQLDPYLPEPLRHTRVFGDPMR